MLVSPFACCALVAMWLAGTAAAAPFTQGNIVVSRVGDGVSILGAGSAAVFIDEITTAGALVQSIEMPTTTVGLSNSLTLPGQNPLACQAVSLTGQLRTMGLLSRSPNGLWVTLMGTVSPIGTAFSNAVISWSVAVISTNGSVDTTTAPLQRHGGDTFPNAVTQDGNEFWWTCSGSGTSGAFTIGYCAPIGTVGSYPGTYASGTSAAINTDVGSAYVDINPFDGNLYMSAQTSSPTGGSTAVTLQTDIYRTPGLPSAGAPIWTGLGLGASLHAPRGFAFLSPGTSLFVADNGYGVRRFTSSGVAWTADPTTYIPNADTVVQQVAVGMDGVTLFVVTQSALYAMNTTSRTWHGGGSPLRQAGSNAHFQGVAQAPFVPVPSPPAVSNSSLTVPEASAAGTPVGAPLGAALPLTPQVTWQILAGAAANTTNVTTFQISACSGQISVAPGALLDYNTQSRFVLTLRAYIDDPAYPTAPQTIVTAAITVLQVNRPPVVATPLALNVTISEASPAGTVLGVPAYTDHTSEPPSNFTWVLVGPDPTNGLIVLNTTGALVVSPLVSATPFDVTVANNYTLPFLMTNRNYPTSFARGTAYVVLTEVPRPPLLSPAGQLLRFLQVTATNAPGLGAATTGGVSVVLHNGPGSPYYAPPVFSLVPPSAAAGAHGCGTTLLSGTTPPTTTGSAGTGFPLFSINASTGALTFLYLPSPAAAWATLPPYAAAGAIVRAAYSVCVNVSNPAFGVWAAGYVVAGVISDNANQAIINGFYLEGAGNNTLYGLDGVTPVMDTAGGGTVFFTGSGFGFANASTASTAFVARYGNAALGLNYSAPCTVVADNALIACSHAPGIGANLSWTVLEGGVTPVLTSGPVILSYAPPVVIGVLGAGSIPTAGGAVVTISGAFFGPSGSHRGISVSFGPTGVEFSCAVTAVVAQDAIQCTTGAAAGALLPLSVLVGGQVALNTSGNALNTSVSASLSFSCAPPTLASIAPGDASVSLGSLTTLGGQALLLNGTNLGPAGSPVVVQLVASGGRTAPALALQGCAHVPGSPHTQLSCSSPPGIGVNLSLSVAAAGVASVAFLPSSLTYSPPSLAAVSAAADSPTSGGTLFSIHGAGFGPASTGAFDFTLYGHNTSALAVAAAAAQAAIAAHSSPTAATGVPPGVYFASGCAVQSDSQAACTVGPGVGRALSVFVSLGGQTALMTASAGGAAPTGLNYAPPFLASFSGPGALGADTDGGQTVLLQGANFGPADAYTASRLAISYATAAYRFTAQSCFTSTAHTVITCTLAPGGGAALSWSVAVDGQASSPPTTSYAPPSILGLSTDPGGATPVLFADADGGDVIFAQGVNFGPPQLSNATLLLLEAGAAAAPPVLLSSVTYGPTGYEYAAAAYTVLASDLLQVTLAPGTGANLSMRIVVGGQGSVAPAGGAATLSFAPPGVLAMLPSSAPTSFAAVLGLTNTQFATLVTTGLPLLDPLTRISFSLGSTPLTAVLPSSLAAVDAVTSGGVTNISVALPAEGAGVGLPLTITCLRGGTVLSSGSSVAFGVAFSYDDPAITGVAVTHPTFNASSSPCPFPAGSPWQCASAALLLVSITGTNFGPNDAAPGFVPDGVVRAVNLSFTAGAGAGGNSSVAGGAASWVQVSGPGTAGTQLSSASLSGSPLLWRWSWSHTRIQLLTTVPAAGLTVSLSSMSALDGLVHVQAASGAYTRVSPSITGLQGAISGLPSAGGTAFSPLIVTAVGVTDAYYAAVTVGGAICSLLTMAGGSCGPAPVTAASAPGFASYADAVNSLVMGSAGQGAAAAPGSLKLCCIPPPGQGAAAPVVLQLFASAGDTAPLSSDASAPGITVAYAPPSLASVEVFTNAQGGGCADAFGGVAGCTAPSARFTVYNFTPGVTPRLTLPTDPTLVRLRGANLGTAPVLSAGDIAVSSGPSSPLLSPACGGDAGAAAAFTCTDFLSPGGEGTGRGLYPAVGGFPFFLSAGGQPTATWVAGYAPASPTLIVATAAAVGGDPATAASFPTSGGTRMTVWGANFGTTPPQRAPAVYSVALLTGAPAGAAAQLGAVPASFPLLNCVRFNGSAIGCTLPPGCGAQLLLSVTVADQTGTSALPLLSYDPPLVTGINVTSNGPWDGVTLSPGGAPLASGATQGGTLLAISGQNFCAGPGALVSRAVATNATGANATAAAAPLLARSVNGSTGFCLFLSWSFIASATPPIASSPFDPTPITPLPVPLCNGLEDYVGEGEHAWERVLFWSDTLLLLNVSEGAGTKDVVVAAQGGVSDFPGSGGSTADTAPRFQYAPPVITAVQPPTGSTDGGLVVTLLGANFGPPARNTSLPALRLAANAQGSLALPLYAGPSLPSWLVRIHFGSGGTCICDALDASGGHASGLAQAAASCGSAIVQHSHTALSFLLPPGVGANISLSVDVVDAMGAGDSLVGLLPLYSAPAPAPFSYGAPFISSFSPPLVTMNGANASVAIIGGDFGSTTDPASAASPLSILVNGLPCASSARSPGLASTAQYGTVLLCGLAASAPVGPVNVSVTVAGQSGSVSSTAHQNPDGSVFSPLLIVCGSGFFGRIGESCLTCPSPGASCAGYNASIVAALATGTVVNDTGLQQLLLALANPADAPFTYPVALPGFYSLSRTCVASYNPDGSLANACVVTDTGSACPPQVRAAFPTRDTCIVGCDPPASCLGANACAPGYASLAPYYGCRSCAPSFYRSNTLCLACPASPIALLVGLLLITCAAAGAGYSLNRRGIHLGFVSIGIDFFQVVAILATTKTAWSTPVRHLLQVLSAFNLDIDLVAPECVVPGTSFKEKYIAILLLPLALAALFLSVHGGAVAYKFFSMRGTRHLNRNLPTLISTLLMLLYILYLYVTRTLLEVFNCAPIYPPDGYTYLQAVPEPCGVSGGTQLALLPWSIIGLVVFSLGYPCAMLAYWWKNRELIMEDQLLRAKGLGDDRLTNPHAYALRKAFGRSYFQFRGEKSYWIVMILARKLTVAVAIVAFNLDPSFQLAAVLLVLLVAYAIQVRVSPYMPPGAYDAELAEHARLSLSSPLHARLRATLASVESRGRKPTRRNVMALGGAGGGFGGIAQRLRMGDVVRSVQGFLFDTNTAEAMLLFAGILVCLLGMMVNVASATADYSGAQDAISGLLMAVIVCAILYIAGAVAAEAGLLVLDARAAAAQRRAAAASSGKLGRKLASSMGGEAGRPPPTAKNTAAVLSSIMSFRSGGGSALRGAGAHPRGVAAEATEQSLNPLFASAAGTAVPPSGPPPSTLEGQAQLCTEAVQLRDIVLAASGPPTPALWAQVRASISSTTGLLEQLVSERVTSRRDAELGEDGGGGPGGRRRGSQREGGGGVSGGARADRHEQPGVMARG